MGLASRFASPHQPHQSFPFSSAVERFPPSLSSVAEWTMFANFVLFSCLTCHGSRAPGVMNQINCLKKKLNYFEKKIFDPQSWELKSYESKVCGGQTDYIVKTRKTVLMNPPIFFWLQTDQESFCERKKLNALLFLCRLEWSYFIKSTHPLIWSTSLL